MNRATKTKAAAFLAGLVVLAFNGLSVATAAEPAATPPVALQLAPIFGDHMVLQREMPVPIWGTAAAGTEVIVEFAGQKKSAKADKDGKWKVVLDPMKASAEGRVLKVGDKQITDVLVGEVWLGAGQSNMNLPVRDYAYGSAHTLRQKDPRLAELSLGVYPLVRMLKVQGKGDVWKLSASHANVEFSGLMFPFGVRLQKELNVPVGLIVVAANGVPANYFINTEMLQEDMGLFNKWREQSRYDHWTRVNQEQLLAYEKAAKQAQEEGKPAPGNKPERRLTPEEFIRDRGRGYRDGIAPLVGLAIRGVLWDQAEVGSGLHGLDTYEVTGLMIKGWRKAWGSELPFIYMQKPSGGGCAWDTNNVVTSWADAFAPLPATVPVDKERETILYVEPYLRLRTFPNTAMVMTSDLGSGVHPVNKLGYGTRAADVALSMVYGRKGKYDGPLYASHAIDAGKARIKFTHVGQGLATRHTDKLQGFAVAGEDKVFHWADAVIEGDTVVVSSANVPQPVAVRYAWSVNRPWANLFSKDGLPAQPFRTDDWSK